MFNGNDSSAVSFCYHLRMVCVVRNDNAQSKHCQSYMNRIIRMKSRSEREKNKMQFIFVEITDYQRILSRATINLSP